ncbi:hypothetical protein OPQ81_000517 [Rhizoctonia solani]|nr:hypothetical protein OPQ81_000517 [Rhizoctonia solani]
MKLNTPSIFVASLAASASANTAAPTVSLPYARYQGFHNSTSGLDVFLGISVYTPPLSSKKKGLPVLVWIHGGGYFFGDAASYDPTAMLQASGHSFVAVIIQYRLGVFGFLPGSEVKKNGALNAGLLDIQFALEWTRENIHLFGGDPEKVTIWGESAGGGAVLIQAVAHGGKTSPALFKHGIASSPYLTPSYSEAVDTLACLRDVDQTTLVTEDTGEPRPVVDGTLLLERPQLSLEKKQVNGELLISLHNNDEGGLFVTRNTSSTVRSWVVQQYPHLSQSNVTAIEDAYQIFASSNATEADNIYQMQKMILAEAIFVCPSIWLADAFSGVSYKGLFSVPPALHGLDLAVYFPEIGYSFIQPAQPISQSLTESFMGALISFIVTGSPNNNPMNKILNPYWEIYDPMDPKSMDFNITASGTADPELKKVDFSLLQRCRQVNIDPLKYLHPKLTIPSLWGALAPFTRQ